MNGVSDSIWRRHLLTDRLLATIARHRVHLKKRGAMVQAGLQEPTVLGLSPRALPELTTR